MTVVARMQGIIDTYSLCINMAYNYYYVDDFEPIVWHEPILTEYWSQLKATIDSKKQQLGIVTDIRMINIENVELKKECMAALVAILSNGGTTISTGFVKIDNANLCDEGIIWLSKLVDVHVELQSITLYRNRIDNMDSARCLSRSLKSHLASIISLWVTVTLEVARKYYWRYYSLTLNISTLKTTILTHWGRLRLLSILKVIHQ
jgi:hypothetical protein